ncbi:sigma-70 family RNA polymerase sigma factor [Kriegella sp. EG-1]|nr:sigma-70 family RNA polymerase sigma factor [Flavobacteriaceae bacterium EG-1]
MNKDLENTFLNALDEHQHKLLRICSVYSKDDDDAKDLFQEVLVNIWKSMPTFQGSSNIGTWMYRITLNVCLRLKTKERGRQKKTLRLDSHAINIYKTETLENGQQEQLVQLRKCIKQLNEADKAVITLYLEELPYKEIAEVTGLTENTIAVKIKRIKNKLLNCLKPII